MMLNIILVSIGAFFGAIARFLIGKSLNKGALPWGTLTVNLLGAFLLGVLFGMNVSHQWMLFLGTGFMGSFTTFSTLKVEHMELAVKQNWKRLLFYSVITYGGGLYLAWVGYMWR